MVKSALVVPVLNSVLWHEGVWELEELLHVHLSRWRIVLSFTLLLALPSGKILRCLLSGRLGVPQNLSEGLGEEISSLHQLEIIPQFHCYPFCCLLSVLSDWSRPSSWNVIITFWESN